MVKGINPSSTSQWEIFLLSKAKLLTYSKDVRFYEMGQKCHDTRNDIHPSSTTCPTKARVSEETKEINI